MPTFTLSALTATATGAASMAAVPTGIGIMGTPVCSGNRGVLALGAALVRLCLDTAPDAQIMLLGSHRSAEPVTMHPYGEAVTLRMVNWRLSPKSAFREHLLVIFIASLLYRCLPVAEVRLWLASRVPWIKVVADSIFIGDVRGGDSFSDIYGLQRFVIATLPVLSVIAVKGGIVQFPQTYGPYKSWIARRIATFILRRSHTIIARDTNSQRVAASLLGDPRRVLLSPDVAFALHAKRPDTIETNPPLQGPLPGGLIGVNVNGLMFNGGYTRKNMFGLKLNYPRFVTELLKTFLTTHPADLLLVPHTFAPAGDAESDNDACDKVRAALPPELRSRVRIVAAEYDAHQLKGIIGACDFFVGSRMHSCIAALSQGVPCVGVAYSMKFSGVFESVGMRDWVVDGREVDTSDAVRAVLDRYHQRDARRANLKRAADQAKKQLAGVFSDLVRAHL